MNILEGVTKEVEIPPEEIISYDIEKPCSLLGFLENSYSKDDNYILCAV